MHKKVLFNWSSGKDSSLALYKLLQNKEYKVEYLFTSVSEKYNRISMHGVRKELLEQQAINIGIPLKILSLPETPTMESYNQAMKNALIPLVNEGIAFSAFGDIFLEDLKKYREEKLADVGLKGLFPLWKIDTRELINEFLDLGFKTIVTCVNSEFLDQSFVGRVIDEKFIQDLPKNVDVCGENGEFHTFTFDGPIFKTPVEFEIGEIVYREYNKPKSSSNEVCNTNDNKLKYGFWYVDLLLKTN